MDYTFSEANKTLNKALQKEYKLKHPEKITYIDKIILWLHLKKIKNYKITEAETGVIVKEKSGEIIYYFKSPDIDMD